MRITWAVLEAAKDAGDEMVVAACRRVIVAERVPWRIRKFPQKRSGASSWRYAGGKSPPIHAILDHYAWRHHCRGLFQMPIAA
jgi:hypothetical protein